MRIGLISSPWFAVPPTAYGGIERVVDTLARGFAAAGHEVLLAAPSDSSCPVPLAPGMREADSAELGMSGSKMNHVIRAYAAMRGWTGSMTTPLSGRCTGTVHPECPWSPLSTEGCCRRSRRSIGR